MKKTYELITELDDTLKALGDAPTILRDCSSSDAKAYNEARQSFNRKFDFRPAAIIYVENTEQVSAIVEFANTYKEDVVLRVRSGGHDHEAESNGTDTFLIDFSKMNEVIHVPKPEQCVNEKDNLFIGIGPGARFTHIKEVLDAHNLGIPHGTCKTVAIAGFTMGGGWGPWTRKYGMACESLVGATIVLGDGEVKELSIDKAKDSPEGRLLWALRGGGGLSYGIVTQLRFKAFELPPFTYSFSLKLDFLTSYFPNITSLQVLKLWEEIIQPGKSPLLIGTNLKINAVHIESLSDRDPNAQLPCAINAYLAGGATEFVQTIFDWLEILAQQIKQPLLGSSHLDSFSASLDNTNLAQSWIEEKVEELTIDENARNWRFESWDRSYHHLGLDSDGPAPHKITSRLADKNWDNESREALICSLQSPLLIPKKEDDLNEYGIHNYITIGAITGDFYGTQNNSEEGQDAIGSAFPYKDRLFTIQYQAWWNEFLNPEGQLTIDESAALEHTIKNRVYSNRTEDWIEQSRDFDIPHTGGAFISFKDSSVTTKKYFSTSYEDLIQVKEKHSKDENMLLKTRKTII